MGCNVDHIPTIGIISQIMHMSMKRAQCLFEQYGLKVGQAGILFVLDHFGEMSQRELASNLNVSPPSITTAIQKMEKIGVITRRTDGKDQRIMRLCLTEQGKACLSDIKKVAQDMEEFVFQDMSKEERLLLRRLLVQMKVNLEGKS